MRFQGSNAVGEPYGGPYDKHARVSIDCSQDGRTRQEFADECDINILMARYEKSGVLTHYASTEGAYFDASDVPDLAHALAIVAHAEDAFMRLPAAARKEFENDAVKFVEFAENADNLPRMREWGLAPPEPAEPPVMRVEVVNGGSKPSDGGGSEPA